MEMQCKQCQQSFEITEKDQEFYRKMDVPPPSFCPKDRLRRRLAFRNERNLYKRICDKTDKNMISNLRPDAPVPVYHTEAWHKDDWSAPELPEYDFSKPFFEQFAGLVRRSPHMHKATAGNEVNSEYINHAGNCKDCYFIFNSEYAQDCFYLRFADHCRDCVDCTNILKSELCYECVNVENCYSIKFSDDCKTCRDSWFLRNCRGVRNSMFCYGLEQKEYHLFNAPCTKEAYEQKVKELGLTTLPGLQKAIETWNTWAGQFPFRREILQNCERCTGDSLYNCKNALDCYSCSELEDCRYVLNAVRVKDAYDLYAYGESELCYEFVTAFKSYNVKFSVYVMQSDHMEYCDTCWGCHYCFGCVGLKGKSYCIFNKQYTKEAYEDLVPRIIKHMGWQTMRAHSASAKPSERSPLSGVRAMAELKNKEYGEFFPISLSPFPYEDSLANDYFPQASEETKLPQGEYRETATLPDDITQADVEDIAKHTYHCPQTNKLFRFQKKELQFYKKMGLPVPRVSFEARYKRRNQLIPFPYET